MRFDFFEAIFQNCLSQSQRHVFKGYPVKKMRNFVNEIV